MAVTFAVSGVAPETRVLPQRDLVGGAGLPYGAALGAGSLPWTDPSEALQHIAEHHARLPYWPQLPGPEGHADMLREALGAASSHVRRGSDGALKVEDLRAFRDGLAPELLPRFAPGFFAFERAMAEGRFPDALASKGQLVGPWTLASALGAPELLGELSFLLTAMARWQLSRLRAFERPVLLVLDEPSLAFVPPEWRERALEASGRVLREVDQRGGFSGLHCCAALDPELLKALSPKVFHFDPLSYGPTAEQGLRAFHDHPAAAAWWEAGGIPALGVVPTRGALPESEAVRATVEALFGDAPYLVSTACGLSGLTPEDAAQRMASLAELAR